MQPWVCPKCGRVWNGMVMECRPCNSRGLSPYPISPTPYRHPGWVPPIKRSSIEM